MIHEKPKNEIFASDAKAGEIVEFPNVKRGWGVTENLGFIPPMEYFNAAFNRVDKALAYQSQRGVGEWSADEEYPIGALSVFGGELYQAKTQNSNKKPSDNPDIWVSFLDSTAKAADADKLDGLDSSAFAKLGQAVPNAVLPQGDYRNVGFWRQIDAGWYWYSISIQGSNNPSSYGFVHVVKMGSECDIYWHSKGSANIFKLGFSGSDSDNTKADWSIVTSELTIGAYPNTAVLRDANGGISAAHLSSSILTGNSATLDLSKADNFEITLTNKGVLTLANGVRGQSGVIAISNAAANITGYASNVKWRTTPTSLQSTETFAYFVWHDGYISIGRV